MPVCVLPQAQAAPLVVCSSNEPVIEPRSHILPRPLGGFAGDQGAARHRRDALHLAPLAARLGACQRSS